MRFPRPAMFSLPGRWQAAFWLLFALLPGTAVGAGQPNIVVVMADDLGWRDVGFHGSKLRTPALDRLAAEGAMLNSFYAQPHSTQTRAALLTGRYPMRYGLQTLSLLPSQDFGLPADERTLAQALKDAGYRTSFAGIWMLGHARPEFWPTRRGFDTFYGALSAVTEASLRKSAKADWRRGEKPARDEGYVTDLLAREATAVVQKHDTAHPLFLMVAFGAPAAYANPPKPAFDAYADIADDARRSYAATVTALDEGIGRIVASLEKRGMLGDTMFVFLSDNGGAVPMRFPTGDGDVVHPAADNGVFREGKGSLYEGGVRVAALAHWPGKIPPKTIVTDPVHVTDLYVTLLRLANATAEQPKAPDGVDVLPVLAERKRTTRKETLLAVEEFRGALRAGEWKLIVHAALPAKVELYDIANDPEEADNQARTYPDRVQEMLGKLNEYAYDMAPSKHLEALAAGGRPVFWRANAPKR